MKDKKEEEFGYPGEAIRIIANVATERMLEADPLDNILREARKNAEKSFLKAYKKDDIENALQHLRCYRVFTKLLNREPLDVFL